MGHQTDHLIELARQVNAEPPAREMDMLLSTGEQVSVALMAMAIHKFDKKAVSLTGAQMGIRTDSSYTKARIKTISTDRIRRLLDEGNIVIAAGFQGIDDDFNITTLGRGGSDTTAVALAAVLGADACEIYTDVDGVYTTDPRLLPEARQMGLISYDEMLELASLGAGVMHNRSIEFAKKFHVPIRVRSSFSDAPGSMIVSIPESSSVPVCGAALTLDEARLTIKGVLDSPGMSYEIFKRLADRKITVDMIVQNIGMDNRADISFTVPSDELRDAQRAIQEAMPLVQASGVTIDDAVAKVSVVGLGMAEQSGVAEKMFAALASAGINIQMITTSEIKISCLVQRSMGTQALRAVHSAFELDKKPADANEWLIGQSQLQKESPDAVVERLRSANLEQLTLLDISLLDHQARITLSGVPDTPGLAEQVFREIAAAGAVVDMIVQSCDGHEGATSISFTVPNEQMDRCLDVLNKKAGYGVRRITSAANISKLSVSGIGLRSHTSVAIALFKALADVGINVLMTNTSELRVNVVIEGKDAQRGLAALKETFASALI
jgi:aspartate kinase